MLVLRHRGVDLAPFAPAVRAMVQAAFRRLWRRAKLAAIANASGKVLARRSGTLARSIDERVEARGLVLVGALRAGAAYAAAQELGASIPARVIRPRRAKALHWIANGQDVFARMSRPGAFTLPARPFLRPAIEAQVPAFEAELDAGLDRLVASMARAARRRAG